MTAAAQTLSQPPSAPRGPDARRGRARGVTLIELVCTTAIVAILAMVAIPIVKTTMRKQKELELRRDLRILRSAIDDYKRMVGDNPQLQTFMKTGSDGYPPELDTLVSGLDTGELKERKIKFLRRIPIDPMTGQADWVIRSNTQDRNVDFWDRMHVFDVRSRSRGVALDGTNYADW
jgi:general secretion pathway protein G